MKITFKKFLEDLKNIVDISTSKGNYDYDPYMHGMANALLVAQSIATGKEPKFKDAPKKWLKDKKDVKLKIENFLDEKNYNYTGLEKDLFDIPKKAKFKIGESVFMGGNKGKVTEIWRCKVWYIEKMKITDFKSMICPGDWVYNVSFDDKFIGTGVYDEEQLEKSLKEEWHDSYKVKGKTIEVFLNPSLGELPKKSSYRAILNIKNGDLYVWDSYFLHDVVGPKILKDYYQGYSDGLYIRLIIEGHNMYGEKNVVWNTEIESDSYNKIENNKNIKKLLGTKFEVKDFYKAYKNA